MTHPLKPEDIDMDRLLPSADDVYAASHLDPDRGRPRDAFLEGWMAAPQTTSETRRVRDAAKDAYRTMDAAVRWAATQTGGIMTGADANRHLAGFDALLDGQVRLGKALGILSDLDPDPLYVGSCCELACYEDPGCTCSGCKAIDADLAAFVAEYEPPTRIFLWLGAAVVVAAILLWVTLR